MAELWGVVSFNWHRRVGMFSGDYNQSVRTPVLAALVAN